MISTYEWISVALNLACLAFGVKLILELARFGRVAPFIRTRAAVAHEVADAFGTLPAGSVIYDPGCGDGRVLFAIAEKNPQAKFVGIELRFFPYLRALWEKRRHPNLDITFIRGNAFKQYLSSATHMYIYLYPHVMDALLPKLERDLKPGTEIISLDFQFSQKTYERTIPLATAETGKLGRLLYVYRF